MLTIIESGVILFDRSSPNGRSNYDNLIFWEFNFEICYVKSRIVDVFMTGQNIVTATKKGMPKRLENYLHQIAQTMLKAVGRIGDVFNKIINTTLKIISFLL